MTKRVINVMTALGLALSLGACSQNTKNEGPDYADDEAMNVIGQGLSKRFAIVDTDETGAAVVKKGVQAEIDTDSPLKNRQFEDSKLHENVISYINVLDESMDVLANYQYQSAEYYEHWEDVYDKRTQILKTFVDKYGLKLQGEDQETLDELVANGASAAKERNEKETIDKMISSTQFEKKDDGYGNFTYTAVIENTSDLSFENVNVVLGLYDADGVKQESYAHVKTWAPGEKVKFEAYSNCDATEIKPMVDYFNVAD
ncbi:FxLYD domain-containing protein [Bifidobacterium pseudolongum]|nr:FxLYD domain-containing protein [Bifidobacterium pseudolongum]